MITFTDRRLYVKGTCNVVCENVETGDVVYQSNKMTTGAINVSTALDQVRFGLGNPVAAVIPTGVDATVDFEAADFQMWAKAAQLGGTVTYPAPVPVCQTIKATSTTLTVDILEGVPVPELGSYEAKAYVQTTGLSSTVASDGNAYDISSDGVIAGFSAVVGKTYKVWYFVAKSSAKMATIYTETKPMTLRFNAQIAVFANTGGIFDTTQGTRIGWLYYTIPHLQLDGGMNITGDQNNADTTKISGQALAYDPYAKESEYPDRATPLLGYMVYIPDQDFDTIQGIAVIGGYVPVSEDGTAQIVVYFVMNDGSLVKVLDYSELEFELAEGASSYVTLDSSGMLTGIAAGETECTITYVSDELETYTCVINIVVERERTSNLVGLGWVGYMIVG